MISRIFRDFWIWSNVTRFVLFHTFHRRFLNWLFSKQIEYFFIDVSCNEINGNSKSSAQSSDSQIEERTRIIFLLLIHNFLFDDFHNSATTMKCRLIHFRLFAEYLTGIFFVASGIVVLSAYFRTEAEDDIFRQERTVLLVVGIIHLAIFVQCLLSCAYTTKLLR